MQPTTPQPPKPVMDVSPPQKEEISPVPKDPALAPTTPAPSSVLTQTAEQPPLAVHQPPQGPSDAAAPAEPLHPPLPLTPDVKSSKTLPTTAASTTTPRSPALAIAFTLLVMVVLSALAIVIYLSSQ